MKKLLVIFLLFHGVLFSQSNVYTKILNYEGDTTHFMINYIANYNNDYYGDVVEFEDSSLLIFGVSESPYRAFQEPDLIEPPHLFSRHFKMDKFGNIEDIRSLDINYSGIESFSADFILDTAILGLGLISDSISFNRELYLTEFDFNGDSLLMKKIVNWSGNIIGFHKILDNYYLFAQYSSYYTSGYNNGNIISGLNIFKFDNDYNLIDSMYIDNYGAYSTKANSNHVFTVRDIHSPQFSVLYSRIGLHVLDTLGNIKLDKVYYFDSLDFANVYNLSLSKDGNFIYLYGMNSHENSNFDKNAFLIKLDILGNLIWKKEFDNAPNMLEEYFQNLVFTSDGNLIVSGKTYDETSSERISWLLKLDVNGIIIWERFLFDDNNNMTNYSLRNPLISNDQGIFLTGSYYHFQTNVNIRNNADALLVKTDSCGFVKGDFPKPSFVIENVNQNTKTVFLTNTSSNYCTATLYFGNGDSTNLYAYSNPTQTQFSYTFADTGTYTIKLKALAGEEFRTYENIVRIYGDTATAIQEIDVANFEVNLFPNPTKESLNIVFNEEIVQNNSIVNIEIKTITGNKVFAKALKTNMQKNNLAISSLANGIYYMSFYNTENNYLGTKKFVVLK